MRRFLTRAVAFLLVFIALQGAWEWARGTWIERLWIHDLTVRSATLLINLITPDAQAVAQQARIVAPGGGLNVLFGCEGTDVVFLLAAAFAVFPLPGRLRVWGLLSGLAWVFVLNQLRIVGLFYTFRADRTLFEVVDGVAAPLVMVVLCGLFFQLWLARATAGPARTPGAAQ